MAKTGHRVLRKNGKLLASAFDPVREATAWAEKVMGAGEPSCDTLIVVGMGSGYHVAALKSRYPDISLLVIDNDAEVVDRAREICPEVAGIPTVAEPKWMDLIKSASLSDALNGVYKIALHGPSFQSNPNDFSLIERLLRGRDKLSFLLLLKACPELLPLLDPEAVSRIGEEAISIKTVSELFSPHAAASRERRLWRVLEELIV